jgi:hypothetical protein
MHSKPNTNADTPQKTLIKTPILIKQWKLAENPARFFDQSTSKLDLPTTAKLRK